MELSTVATGASKDRGGQEENQPTVPCCFTPAAREVILYMILRFGNVLYQLITISSLLLLKNRGGSISSVSMDQPPQVHAVSC